MTTEQIAQKQRQHAARCEVALQIRKLLDQAEQAHQGEDEWSEVEAEILAMVTDE